MKNIKWELTIYRWIGGFSIWIQQVAICFEQIQYRFSTVCTGSICTVLNFEHITKSVAQIYFGQINSVQKKNWTYLNLICTKFEEVQNNMNSNRFYLPRIKLNSNIFCPKRLELGRTSPTQPRTRAQAQPARTDGGARVCGGFFSPMGLAHFAYNLILYNTWVPLGGHPKFQSHVL